MSASASPSSTPAPKKRTLDIEAALQWAFREEAPKMREEPGPRGPVLPAIHPMWRAGAFGSRIDNWNNVDPGFPLAMGEPHPDAVLIINAARGCDVEKLELWGFLIPYGIGENFDQVGIMEKARRETVAVLTSCATRRCRPDVGDQVEIEPVRSITGQITVWVRETREYEDAEGQPIFVPHDLPTKPLRKGVYPAGAFCKIRYCPSAATVALDRAKYAAWWAALQHVTELLQVMGLATIEITGPAAPRSPWIDAPAASPPASVLPNERPTFTERADAEEAAETAAAVAAARLEGRRGLGRRAQPARGMELRQAAVSLAAPAETA